MKPVNVGGHASYRSALRKAIKQNGIDLSAFPKSTQNIYKKFRDLDLSQVDSIMKDKYSVFGPIPRLPSCLLRSLLIALAFKSTSITNWVAALRITPFYAILSGFSPNDTPGVGTFYDFIHRLWDGTEKNYSPNVRPIKEKVNKPKGKGKKADSIEKENVEQLILRLLRTDFILDQQAYRTVFTIFKRCFLDQSVLRGIINPEHLRVSGDGTPIVTSARERRHRVCDCKSKGIFDCDCPRFFSQPDCDIGWDSSRDRFYFGYDMYVLTDSEHDLPLFPLLHPASKHDSHGFCEAFFRFQAFLPDLKTKQLLLDSAHDAMAIYSLCHAKSITPFIDLNLGNSKKPTAVCDISIAPDGVPICPKGLKMKSNGNDLKRQYAKFRCPLASYNGCSCDSPCSPAKFGRTFSVPLASNIRLYNVPPRGSDEWKSIYNSRTASERSNKREKEDYLLERGHHRSTELWYIRVYLILMMQHLDAWSRSTD